MLHLLLELHRKLYFMVQAIANYSSSKSVSSNILNIRQPNKHLKKRGQKEISGHLNVTYTHMHMQYSHFHILETTYRKSNSSARIL